MIMRHGELYYASHEWNVEFEALVARIASDFVEDFDPAFARSWIAEKNGERVGSVFLTRKSDVTAQLRMLIVEPSARGLGLGRRLVAECVGAARELGYQRIGLFTSRGLDSARRLYEVEGLRLVSEKEEDVWGRTHVAQWWELDL